MNAIFKKVVENFVCGNCGNKITGSGLTNHCTKCLWSKHVDIEPGDRRANCYGMMKPFDLEIVANKYVITHKCEICGKRKKNKISKFDEYEAVVALSESLKKIES